VRHVGNLLMQPARLGIVLRLIRVAGVGVIVVNKFEGNSDRSRLTMRSFKQTKTRRTSVKIYANSLTRKGDELRQEEEAVVHTDLGDYSTYEMIIILGLMELYRSSLLI
jgi:hypothetical protein